MLLQHTSPDAMVAMQRASAIIAETGSLTGHMASVCREFGMPTVINLPGATSLLEEGEVVTVDAIGGRVFKGEIPELLALRLQPRRPAADTPALILLRRIASYIMPLHLVDPHSELFSPANCTSLHDVMRYAHEKSYSEMFLISDSVTEGSMGAASQLVCPVPLDLYIIDLGGGLRNPESRRVTPGDVISEPFAEVLSGMLNPAVQARGPPPRQHAGLPVGHEPEHERRQPAGRPAFRGPQLRHRLGPLCELLLARGLPLRHPGQLVRRDPEQELHPLSNSPAGRRQRAARTARALHRDHP